MKPAPEQFRLSPEQCTRLGITTQLGTDESAGNNGFFYILYGREILRCMVSDGSGCRELGLARWEHVSVSLAHRCPTWTEMCFVRDAFFGPEEVVMQLHPKRSEYVNMHPYTLHLWKALDAEIPTPPSIMVGLK